MQKNVIALGHVASGKSWFLNQLLGKREFVEALRFGQPTTTSLAIKSRNFKDNINKMAYILNLYDHPGITSVNDSSSLFQQIEFSQIFLITKIANPIEEGLDTYLTAFKHAFYKSLQEIPASITLVINYISSGIDDQCLIDFYEKVRNLLQFKRNECICIRLGETHRDFTFKYLMYSQEEGYQFVDQNLLAIISRSAPVLHDVIDIPKPSPILSGLPPSAINTVDPSKILRPALLTAGGSLKQVIRDRSVIVWGLVGSGKSWFLNHILGETLFEESRHFLSCTKKIEYYSMMLRANQELYFDVKLYDTPGLGNSFERRSESFAKIMKKLSKHIFDRIVLVCELTLPVSMELIKALGAFKYYLEEAHILAPASFTLVINQITPKSSRGQLAEFLRAVRSYLGVDIQECICIYYGELVVDGRFNYFFEETDGSFKFVNYNFTDVLVNGLRS